MTKKNLWPGILAIMLVFTMTVIGCDLFNGIGISTGGSGTFTLNNIPAEFNGKYVNVGGASGGLEVIGCQSKSAGVYTLCLISNGSVSLPMWTENNGGNLVRYSGNDSMDFQGYIWGSQTLSESTSIDLCIGKFRFTAPVAFTKGSATKSWSNVNYTANTENGNNNGNGGTFTLNNIPAEFNGKYVNVGGAGGGLEVIGCQSKSAGVYTLCLISNGSVSLPMWTENNGGNLVRYSGNDSMDFQGYIWGSQTLSESASIDLCIGKFRFTAPVAFTNGSATKSWGDANYTANTENGNNSGGTFTLNNIPAQFNGKYVNVGGAGGGLEVIGCQSKSAGVYTLCLISNGSVSLPMWTENNSGNLIRYSGNDIMDFQGYIWGSQTLSESASIDLCIGKFRFTAPVAFTNGNATKFWSDVNYTANE